MEKPLIEYRIMGVRERAQNVENLMRAVGIPESAVFFDDDRNGCIWNAFRTWTAPLEAGTTHVCVLQDDVEVVNNFREITGECAERFPDAIFGFFHYTLRPEHKSENTPYIRMLNCNLKGECMMMPVKYIEGYKAFYDKYLKDKNYPHDDATARMFALLSDIPVYSTIPGLVHNLCPTQSVMGHNDPEHYSRVWEGKDIDAGQFATNEFAESPYFPIFTHLSKDDPLNVAVKEKMRRNKLKRKALLQ